MEARSYLNPKAQSLPILEIDTYGQDTNRAINRRPLLLTLRLTSNDR